MVEEKYKAVRAKDYIGTEGNIYIRPIEGENIRVTTEISQLDRIEKKVDRVLHILENGELSTSSILDGKALANTICQKTWEHQRTTRRP